jgi:hypothetical protein
MFPGFVQHFCVSIVLGVELAAEQIGREGDQVQGVDFITSFQISELERSVAVIRRIAVQVTEVS